MKTPHLMSRKAYLSQIHVQIKALVIEWGEHPYDINNGDCEEFAKEIADLVDGASWEWDSDRAHCYIVYEGKYYDAECPHGVKQCHNLPLYHRNAILDKEKSAMRYFVHDPLDNRLPM